jgi:hypothetical protein
MPASGRVLRARLAAHSMHAQGKTNTAPARKAFLNRFEFEVDPDKALPLPSAPGAQNMPAGLT